MLLKQIVLVPNFQAVTETTIGNNNKDLLKYIRPTAGVLSWIRVQVANRISTSALKWVQIFRKQNSGT